MQTAYKRKLNLHCLFDIKEPTKLFHNFQTVIKSWMIVLRRMQGQRKGKSTS